MSTGKPDPGSYAIHDAPFDTYGATLVPLRTPHGPVTLHFTDADHVYASSGYQAAEYGRGQAYLNTDDEAFTWKGADVVGSAHFYRATGWSTENPDDLLARGTHFTGKGRNITPLMAQAIAAYWQAVIVRYVTEHPLIPAHAGLRDATRKMTEQEKGVRKAEEQLAGLRRGLTAARRHVRRALTAEYPLREPKTADMPRPYHGESLNGYVTELENSRHFITAITH